MRPLLEWATGRLKGGRQGSLEQTIYFRPTLRYLPLANECSLLAIVRLGASCQRLILVRRHRTDKGLQGDLVRG